MTAAPTVLPAPADPPWNALGRPALGVQSTPLLSVLLAAVTFGLLPAALWPSRWARLLDRERHDYLDLTNWWRRRVATADAQQLDQVLNTLRPRPLLVVLPWLAVGFVAAVLGVGLYTDGPERVWATTYGFHHTLGGWPVAGSFWDHLRTAWLWGLGAAYACQFYAVRSHARAVGDLVRWTNRVARDNNYRKVRNEAARTGLGPVWVLAAVGFGFAHAWWAIPMVIAGAAQRRYADVATGRLRRSLRAQAGDAVVAADGASHAPTRVCPANGCGALLPSAARYCSRCGTAAVYARGGGNPEA